MLRMPRGSSLPPSRTKVKCFRLARSPLAFSHRTGTLCILASLFSVPPCSEPLSMECHPPEQPSSIFNSSSPSQTQLPVATPSRVLPPANHQDTLLTERQDTDVCVPSPSWPPWIFGAEPSAMPHPHLPWRVPTVRKGTDIGETEALGGWSHKPV